MFNAIFVTIIIFLYIFSIYTLTSISLHDIDDQIWRNASCPGHHRKQQPWSPLPNGRRPQQGHKVTNNEAYPTVTVPHQAHQVHAEQVPAWHLTSSAPCSYSKSPRTSARSRSSRRGRACISMPMCLQS